MTLIAYISLLVAALLDLCVVLHRDMQVMQRNQYRCSNYNKWLRESGELSSPKRLLVLAVLIAIFTTMAQVSWIVVMLLAAALAIQAIVLLSAKGDEKRESLNKRSWRAYALAIVLTLAITAAAGYLGSRTNETDATRSAATITVMILAITPLLTMLVNWLLYPIENRNQSGTEKGKK